MSEEKRLKARVQNKRKTEAEWYLDVYDSEGKLREDAFKPLKGELIIFAADYSAENPTGCKYDRSKFGDGITNVIDLPFTDANITEELETRAQRLAEIDQADWEEDAVPQEWIDKEISKEDFPYAVEGIGKLQKTKGSGYAYDFGRAYNRVYVERSGDGWGGHGGGQYAKFALTQDPVPVPDPDYKDWEKDENGNVIAPKEGKFNSSIPIRLPNSHILVPENASVYNDRRQAMSLGCYEDKTAKLRSDITTQIDTRANAITATKESELVSINDHDITTYTMFVTGTPGSKTYVHGENLARSSTETAAGTGSWSSTGYSIHAIKNRTYTLSCNFERISGSTVGIAIKPDHKSVAAEPSSAEASGTLIMTLNVGDCDTVALMFYSNYSGSEIASECKFTNIVFALADMDVKPGTEGYIEQAYTLDENGEAAIPVPTCSPALIYNPDSEVLHVEYNKDINKHFNSYLNTMSVADEERIKLYEDYNAENNNVRPFNQELYDDLIATERVYVEDDRHGGINPLYALSLSRNYIPYNPWGFRTAEECGNRPYVEKTDAEGNTTYHPAMGAIMCMRSDGNAKVLGTPSDSKDVIPLGFAKQHYPDWDNAIAGKYSLPIKTRYGSKKWIKATEYQDTDVEDVSIPLRHKGGIIKTTTPQSPADAANKYYVDNNATSVINVTELPTANINTNKIYNLFSATFIHNRHVVDNSKCYIVENRPEVGEPATNLERNAITAYYDLSDGKVYGYLDETLAVGFSQLAGATIVAGWYPAEQLLPIAGWSYAGVIDHIGKDPNDSTIRLLLEKRVYIYQNEWIELTNSVVDEKLPTPDNNGHFAYTVQRRDGVDAYELHLISHTINEAYENGELMYPYQIPLRENGIIKAATPKENLDVANKKYVDDKFASSGNLTEKQAAQVAKINSTNDKFDGTYDSLNNKAFIPTALSHLTSNTNYRTVTDTEKAAWNNKLDKAFPEGHEPMGGKAFTPGWWTGYIQVTDNTDAYTYRQYSLGTFYVSKCDISNYRTCEVSVWNDKIKRRIEIDCNTGNWTPYNENGAVVNTTIYAAKIQ